MYSSSTQDCANKFAVAREVYGFPFTQPFPDLERIRCLVIVGANPVISKWSFLQVPNPARALQAIEARGGRIFVVDPRRTETARAAGEHVFIRPDTDVFFYLSFLRELLAAGVDEARIGRFAKGLEAIRELCAPWTPERTAEVTRIPPAKLREMVEAFRTADGAALYSSTGVNMGSNGSLAFWLQEVANCVSGNLDRPGGTLVGNGVIDFAAFGKKTGTLMRNDRSRIGDFLSVNDGFPGGILADEILTPGDRQVRALFVTGGNPLITMANAGRLRQAFEKLELLVTLDIFRNETGSVAHYVLPCTSPLERPDLPFIFPLMLGMQERPYLQATDAVLPPPGDVRDEASIYLDLCRASGVSLFGSRIAQGLLQATKAVAPRPGSQPAVPQKLLLSAILRATGQGSFRSLLRAPHGRLREPNRGGDFLEKRVVTDDRLVDLAPRRLLEQAGKLEGDFEREKGRPGPAQARDAPCRDDPQLLDPQHPGLRRTGDQPALHPPGRCVPPGAGGRGPGRRLHPGRHGAPAGEVPPGPHAGDGGPSARMGPPACLGPVDRVTDEWRERELARRRWSGRHRAGERDGPPHGFPGRGPAGARARGTPRAGPESAQESAALTHRAVPGGGGLPYRL